MSTEVMESYIRQTIEAHSVPEITIAWQGGEPTLMGLDFYRLAVETAERYRKPSVTIRHTIQTNGTLLDDEWCEFLRENRFLVGISLDGPREMHNAYRRDKAGQGTFDRGVKGARPMQRHQGGLQRALRRPCRQQRKSAGRVSIPPGRVGSALLSIPPHRRACQWRSGHGAVRDAGIVRPLSDRDLQ